MDIRCRKTQCEFNDKYTCKAREITVDKNVTCSSFVLGNKKVRDVTRSMFEVAPEFAPQRCSKTICINCKTDCIFVENKKCTANGITINAVHEIPKCMTYLKK